MSDVTVRSYASGVGLTGDSNLSFYISPVMNWHHSRIRDALQHKTEERDYEYCFTADGKL